MPNKLYINKKTDSIVFLTVTLFFLSICVGVLAMPKVSFDGAKSGLNYAFGILIPSLFPFIFLSNFAVEYGISHKLGTIFARFTEKVLYLPSEAGVTVLLSFIGGFPVGAVGINALYKQGKISERQAQRMLCFCVNSGPAFLISVVGTELYDSELVGITLFFAQVLSSLLIGIILGIQAHSKEPLQRSVSSASSKKEFAPSFILSAKNACRSTVDLCALVILFSSFMYIFLHALKINDYSAAGMIIRSILEVTDGCSCLSNSHVPLYYTALAIGWSGICVHFQIFAAVDNLIIKKIPFYISRFANGILSAVFTFIAMVFIPADISVFSNFSKSQYTFSSSTLKGSAALFISSILFLIFVNTYVKSCINSAEQTADKTL